MGFYTNSEDGGMVDLTTMDDADPDAAAALAKAYQAKKDEIERLYAAWEALEAEE